MGSAERLARLSRELVVVAFASDRSAMRGLPERMARWLDERSVVAGETIYAEGDMPEHLFFMVDGRVRFSRAGAPGYARAGRWVLGSHEVLADKPRMRTAVAETDLRLVTVPAEPWIAMVEDNVDRARRMALEVAAGVTAFHARLGPDGGFAGPAPPCPARSGDLNFVQRLLLLRGVPLLGGAEVQALSDLAGATEVRELRAGEPLFERGVPRAQVFIVAEGLVEVRREDPQVTGRFGPGALVGGAVALGDRELRWEARALEPSRLLAVPIEVWGGEMDDHFGLFRSAVATLSDQREELIDRLAAANGGELVLR